MEHFHHKIPGWAAFADLYVEQVKRASSGQRSRFVEVGSWLGKSAALMAVEIANSGKPIQFSCVDPWLDGGPDLKDTKYFKDLAVKDVYDIFLRNISPVQAHVRAMRMPSVEAARFFADQSIDFVMLDGDHSYEAVQADIEAWLPKMIRDGGVISGDDYTWPGVEQAVAEAFRGQKVNTVINKGKRRNADYRKDSSYWWVQV